MVRNRTISRLLKLAIILITFDLIQVLCIGGIWSINDLWARNELGKKLGIESNWQSLEKYIKTHFELGMTRDEVIRQAEEIGLFFTSPYFIGADYCELYVFNVGPFESSRGGRWDICYNQDNIVIRVEQYRYQ